MHCLHLLTSRVNLVPEPRSRIRQLGPPVQQGDSLAVRAPLLCAGVLPLFFAPWNQPRPRLHFAFTSCMTLGSSRSRANAQGARS